MIENPLIYASCGLMEDVLRKADRVADTNARVLITGETGVGKELVAQRIHGRSNRQSLEAVNCAGVPESLLETELFGHVRGSFTGAHKDHKGRFEKANKGTLFLDEIGEMTPKMQSAVLRTIETNVIDIVGGGSTEVDVRIIAATRRDLQDMVDVGGFREDLYYRLNVYPIHVPPLRDRLDDVPLLIKHFLPQMAQRHRRPLARLSPEVYNALLTYYWPGNVRELQNLLERLTIDLRGGEAQLEDLPQKITSTDEEMMDIRNPNYYVVNKLYASMTNNGGLSFWQAVYEPYIERDVTRAQVQGVVEKGLVTTSGNFKQVVTLFNMRTSDYKKFLNFLRKHRIQPDFKTYRKLHQQSAVA